jgi:hypothetical protein
MAGNRTLAHPDVPISHATTAKPATIRVLLEQSMVALNVTSAIRSFPASRTPALSETLV